MTTTATARPAAPRLTRDEEQSLAATIRAGLAVGPAPDADLPADDLAARRAGRAAESTMAEANMPLALALAGKYSEAWSVDFDDLFGAAQEGLFLAIRGFRPDRFRVKFGTYATHVIVDSLRKERYRLAGFIHVPSYLKDAIFRISRGLRPAKEIPDQYIRSGMEAMAMRRSEGPGDLDRAAPGPGSPLDRMIDEEEGGRRRRSCKRLLRGLTTQQRAVLLRRFPAGSEPETLADIGRSMGLSREKIRQVESAALWSLGIASTSEKIVTKACVRRSPYAGAEWMERGKAGNRWRASVTVGGVRRSLGAFPTALEAGRAYRLGCERMGVRPQARRGKVLAPLAGEAMAS
jgi:RNA polymerase sigma factor (sigma-70 family)